MVRGVRKSFFTFGEGPRETKKHIREKEVDAEWKQRRKQRIRGFKNGICLSGAYYCEEKSMQNPALG